MYFELVREILNINLKNYDAPKTVSLLLTLIVSPIEVTISRHACKVQAQWQLALSPAQLHEANEPLRTCPVVSA